MTSPTMQEAAAEGRDVWHPIETAPKDGRPLLMWDGDSYLVAVYCGCKKHWFMAECENNKAHEELPIECEPTHWMPLPKPPTAPEANP